MFFSDDLKGFGEFVSFTVKKFYPVKCEGEKSFLWVAAVVKAALSSTQKGGDA